MKCNFCDEPIPNEHGNSRHCSESCYKLAKSFRQKFQRIYINIQKLKLKNAERILCAFHRRFGSFRIFDPKLLDQQGFDFSLSEKNITHKGKLGTQIGQFAYVLFDKNNMYLWKLKTE